ncbi:MAG TPA: SRPBCC domain-containing protein [Candidatus Dormibacteraeota bacterium]|nr:SRPBCC domain-containing protein [Candidatus Dormibacteraeota bacterium]
MSDPTVTHATFTLERVYPVPPIPTCGAWADPKVKGRWFAGNADGHELDFRPGGLERTRGTIDGKHIAWESLDREIVTDVRIVYTSVLTEDDNIATVSLTTVEFFPDGDGTRLVFVEAGAYLDGWEQPAWREQGTSDQLDALGSELPARPGK